MPSIKPEMVCEDVSNGTWLYDRAVDLFFRKEGDSVNAKIYGRYLPEPMRFMKDAGRPLSAIPQKLWSYRNAK